MECQGSRPDERRAAAVKRDLKAKDWGYIIEGHGGVLDRVDSLTFAAPLFFHVTRYWFTV